MSGTSASSPATCVPSRMSSMINTAVDAHTPESTNAVGTGRQILNP